MTFYVTTIRDLGKVRQAWKISPNYYLNTLLYKFLRNRTVMPLQNNSQPGQTPVFAYQYKEIQFFENTSTKTKHPVINNSKLIIALSGQDASRLRQDFQKTFGHRPEQFEVILPDGIKKSCLSFTETESTELQQRLPQHLNNLRVRPLVTSDDKHDLRHYANSYLKELATNRKPVKLVGLDSESLQIEIAERLDNVLANVYLLRKAAKALYWMKMSECGASHGSMSDCNLRTIEEIRTLFGDDFVAAITDGGSSFGSHRTVTLMNELGIQPIPKPAWGWQRWGFFGSSANSLKPDNKVGSQAQPAYNPSGDDYPLEGYTPEAAKL